ncbi:NADH-ubiquinone oxidoreductase-F iron-sulfur binding region domain-containing protein [Streptomyces sp. NPDC002073]|uniref:NADH-ubiquinone oxidoreductase-F iron-sulfur binding region domain-containing protein n=1 Tax=Streptomyces sp. NBC_00239 TaxID=2903640 RepID=UPI002E2CD1DA|nr:NADH-ubiquinone oxidoreductase-F iron-sulfur binding region domain-containing protein [Streptomyces sp. NBC_00239]
MSATLPALTAVGPPRLLAGLDRAGRLDRVAHLAVHGSLPRLRPEELVALAEDTGLRGRGGAGFPFARKLRAVLAAAGGRAPRTAVVVNGSEGEPGCLKDTALLLYAPHLVLDGALLAAAALGAGEVAVGVHRADVERSVRGAVAERGPDARRVRVERLPDRFVAGESSALVAGLGGGAALPSGRRVRTSESGLGGLPTLLSNTETFAQLAVAARLGALPYRETGDPAEPGTVLLTVAGTWVVEAPTGVPLPYVLRVCGLEPGRGVLVGGYHGGWLGPRDAARAVVSRESLAGFGAVLGAGAVLPLPHDTCPVGETLRVVRWLAAESAGQCGPCVLGLPALADVLAAVERGAGPAALDALHTALGSVRGRGACSHPDGTARFAASAAAAFPDEFAAHAVGAGCGLPVLGALPVPAGRGPVAAPPLAADSGPDGPPGPRTEALTVDWTLCQGHGLCADIVPEVVELGADGYPAQAAMPVPRRLRGQAVRAVRRCPALALRMQG